MCLLPNKMCYYLCFFVPLSVLLGIPHSVADIIVLDQDSNETIASFKDRTASFGPDFPDDGLEGKIVPAEPPDACSRLTSPPGKDLYILLVARGGGNCHFVDKVLNAQEANYSAVIVHNHNGDDELVDMGGDGRGLRIPATFVGFNDGMALNKSYNYNTEYVIRIIEPNSILPDFLVWPFVLVVGICFMVGVAYMIIKICRDHIKKKGSRLSSRNLKKIPVRKFKKGDYYDTCAICLDEYEEGEKIRVLPCDHVYHTKCIDPWLTKNKKTCPVCKRRVIPGKDADSESSDSDGGGTPARAENTPLLQGNTARQYAYRGTTRFPRRAGTSNHAADDDEETRNVSEDAGNVGTSSTIPTDHSAITISDSEPDTGAVGGIGISDQQFNNQDQQRKSSSSRRSKHESANKEKRENRAERKRKRPDKERLIRLADERNETDTVTGDEELAAGISIQVDETREERRERRRKKKEQKKASKKSSQTKETPSHTAEEEIEAGSRSQPNEMAEPQSSVGEEQGAPPMSISDGQDVRLPTRARRFELNEVV
ncbi:unnamed protein product [Lymnaea stagnalis]|uniref:RING-type E3 ubiquitin transferase n=1 Tax=Lymnaea stagnalis TaxID=6523 RepID=A0AAV2I7N8_LYMST